MKPQTPIVAVLGKAGIACDGKPTWWWYTSNRTREADIPPQLWQDHTLRAKTVHSRMTEAHHRALRVCAMCPLALTCAQAAWDTEAFGTFGGLSETERYAFGGRGQAGGNQQRTSQRRERILQRLRRRFGMPDHPVVLWLEQLHAAMPETPAAEPVVQLVGEAVA